MEHNIIDVKKIEDNDGIGFIVSVQMGKKVEKGYGKTEERAYNMACFRTYNLNSDKKSEEMEEF